MALEPFVQRTLDALQRGIPLPDSVCCPTCRVGEDGAGNEINIHYISKLTGTTGEGVTSMLTLFSNRIVGLVADNNFSGNLNDYEEYVDVSTNGLIEFGTFSEGSYLGELLKMVKRLYNLSDPNLVTYLDAILSVGLVTICIDGEKFITNAANAHEYITKGKEIILDDKIDCYFGFNDGNLVQ